MVSPRLIEEWASLSPGVLDTQARRVMGENERTFILACTVCFGLFDVPKGHRPARRLPEMCDSCGGKQARAKRRRT